MTNVAGASMKAATDGSVGGLFGKASSQNGEAGEFAQVLTDADADTGKMTEDGNASADDGTETGRISLGSSRFKSLTDLTSLAANFKATDPAVAAAPSTAAPIQPTTAEAPIADPQLELQQPAAQPAPAPSVDEAVKVARASVTSYATLLRATAEVPVADPQLELQQPAAQPVPAPSADEVVKVVDASATLTPTPADKTLTPTPTPTPTPVPTGETATPMPTGVTATPKPAGETFAPKPAADTSTPKPAGEDQTGGQIEVAQLVATATKRVTTVAGGDDKAKATDLSSKDLPVDEGQGTGLASAVLDPALSAAALLNLTASVETGNPSQSADIAALSAMISVTESGIPNDQTDIGMPSDDTDDATSFNFLDSGEAEPQTDVKSYRFQKAGDAIAAVSLSIVTGADGGSDLQDSLPGTPKTETITVLDSRRYLGFGVGENASNLLSAASNNREWTAAMQPSSALTDPTRTSGTGSVVNTLKLQLTPDNLGTVTAHMRLVGDQLSIHLTVHSSMAYRELSDDSKPMLDALRAQGFNVDQVTVSMAPSTDSSNASADQQQGGNNAQTQQQLARDGEAARQQGQAQGGRSNDGNRNDTEKRNETAVETDIGSTGTGDIYL